LRQTTVLTTETALLFKSQIDGICFRLLSAKAASHFHKRTCSCPDSKHLLSQRQSAIMPSHLYKAYKSGDEGQSEFTTSKKFSQAPILSFSLIQIVLLFSANLPFPVFRQNHPCKYLHKVQINFKFCCVYRVYRSCLFWYQSQLAFRLIIPVLTTCMV